MKTLTYKPFLSHVIHKLNIYATNRPKTFLVIFPTDLSIDYFQTILKSIDQNSRPTCLTLRQYILSKSPIHPVPTLILLQKLYRLCKKVLPNPPSFTEFYPLGLTLLQDFDLLDRHLINGSKCFSALTKQKQLNRNSGIQDEGLMKLWAHLPLIYQTFTQTLIQEGIGYEGLCYKIAAQNKWEATPDFKILIVVGFNYFTPSEEQCLIACQKEIPVKFFWDTDPYYLDNTTHLAGYYFRQYKQNPLFKMSFSHTTRNYLNDTTKKIIITAASSTIEQIQLVIDRLKATKDNRPLPLHQTAIIISHTELLIPLLDKLAKLNIPLHCKLPYPIYGTLIYTCLEKLIQIWQYAINNTITDQHKLTQDLMAALIVIVPLLQPSVNIPSKLQSRLLTKWLKNIHKDLLSYLKPILGFINERLPHSKKLCVDLNKKALQSIISYIDHLYTIQQADCTPSFFLTQLKNSTIPCYQHNPSTGLYIIDILESQNLDFEYLFFLNMHEGHFPKIPHNASVLNYDIRHNFGLALTDQVVYKQTAYNFYRLLQRAQYTYCSYVKQSPLGISNEISRLLLQLSFDSPLQIIQNNIYAHPLEPTILTISIKKTQTVMQLLTKFLVTKASKPTTLTPSAIISYLTCPLQFYFAYLLQLKQTTPFKDGKEALQLGQLLHTVLEKMYQPLVGRPIDKTILIHLKSTIKPIIQAEIVNTINTAHNAYAFLGTIVEKLAERIIDLDIQDLPLTILGIEMGKKKPITMTLAIDQDKQVQLGGIIDRIDIKDQCIRIIDYKTGASYNKFSTIEDLFNRTAIQHNKSILQLMFYTWLFKKTHDMYDKQHIMPYLVQVKELFLEDYTPHIFIKSKTNQTHYKKIEDITPYTTIFQQALIKLINNIFDPKLPFSQTDNPQSCTYCPYILICQKDKKTNTYLA